MIDWFIRLFIKWGWIKDKEDTKSPITKTPVPKQVPPEISNPVVLIDPYESVEASEPKVFDLVWQRPQVYEDGTPVGLNDIECYIVTLDDKKIRVYDEFFYGLGYHLTLQVLTRYGILSDKVEFTNK